MRAVFADTGYWLGLLLPHDTLHEPALQMSRLVQDIHLIQPGSSFSRYWTPYQQTENTFGRMLPKPCVNSTAMRQ